MSIESPKPTKLVKGSIKQKETCKKQSHRIILGRMGSNKWKCNFIRSSAKMSKVKKG